MSRTWNEIKAQQRHALAEAEARREELKRQADRLRRYHGGLRPSPRQQAARAQKGVADLHAEFAAIQAEVAALRERVRRLEEG